MRRNKARIYVAKKMDFPPKTGYHVVKISF